MYPPVSRAWITCVPESYGHGTVQPTSRNPGTPVIDRFSLSRCRCRRVKRGRGKTDPCPFTRIARLGANSFNRTRLMFLSYPSGKHGMQSDPSESSLRQQLSHRRLSLGTIGSAGFRNTRNRILERRSGLTY